MQKNALNTEISKYQLAYIEMQFGSSQSIFSWHKNSIEKLQHLIFQWVRETGQFTPCTPFSLPSFQNQLYYWLDNGQSCPILLPNIYFIKKDLGQSCQDQLLPAHCIGWKFKMTFIQGLGHRQLPLPTRLNNDAHTLNSSRIPGQILIN